MGIVPKLVRLRVSAYVIDIALLFAVLAPTGWLIQRAFGWVPSTASSVWFAALLNFSIPSWLYFTLGDASEPGATFGKRFLKLRVSRLNGDRVKAGSAMLRTAVKLLPWELVHLFGFALAPQAGELTVAQSVGLAAANVLVIIYLVCALVTHGRRSVTTTWREPS